MILAITNSNEKTIREICAKNDYDDIEVYTGIKDLQDFSIRELQNLNNFKYLILDMDVVVTVGLVVYNSLAEMFNNCLSR